MLFIDPELLLLVEKSFQHFYSYSLPSVCTGTCVNSG